MDSSDNRKKGKFFYDIVVIQVEDTLHRIPRYHLETWSQTFKDMFQLPQGGHAEGSSNDHPIILPGCTNDEFESLLTALFTPTAVCRLNLSKDQWISILKLATMWEMAEFRKLAIEKLSPFKLTPTNKVQLGKKYKVASWLIEGCTALIQDARIDSLDALGTSLGWETAARIMWAAKKIKGPLVIGSEKWQCPGCSRAGTLGNKGTTLNSGSRRGTTYSAPTALAPWGYLPAETPPSPDKPILQCSTCSHSGDSIKVDVPTLEGSERDSVSAVVKEVFVEELKTMY